MFKRTTQQNETLIWLLNSVLSVKIPVTIEEVTSPAVRFNSWAGSMIVHPSDPRLLIVIDLFAIWEFDPETKTKTLIAGSTTHGYVEGFGENARFGQIYGSAKFNKTTIIITSYMNHCMRLVNTETRMTERYAGVCQSYGFKDGDRLSAQFSYPWGISRIGADFYVCDQLNKKIRKIAQNVVSTITSPSYDPRGLSSNNDKLIYTFLHGLGEFDLKSQSNKILTGGSSSGYTDGNLSSAQFYHPYDVIPLAENLFAILDYSNRAVRIVDLNKQFVSSVDLSGKPHSVLAYNGNMMVGVAGGSILKFNMSKLPVTQINIKCEINLTLSTSDYSVLFQPQIETSADIKCVGCPEDQNISVGVHQFISTYYNKIGYVQKICEQTVTVVAVGASVKCPSSIKLMLPDRSSSLNANITQPDINGTRLECLSCPSATQQLSVGNHNMTFIYKDNLTRENVSCSYTIEVIKTTPDCHNNDVEVNCPKDMEIILPSGLNELNITLPQPQVDELRLKCINCLDSVQSLSEGVHNITYDYMDMIYNQTTSCSYLINVTKQSTPVCQNETRRLFLKPDQQKTDEIKIGNTGVGMRLDSGVLEINIRDDCYITFIVNEVSSLERKVTLEAEYPIECSTLNKISFIGIDSYLSHHTKYLKMYCPDCQIDESAPISTCTNDTLISSWRTNISADTQVLSADIKSKLHTALVQFQSKYPVMDVTIITTLPRTISPIKDSTGLNIRVVIKTTCTDKDFSYNRKYDVCERVTN